MTWTRDKTTVDIFDAVDWTSSETIHETYWRQLDEQFASHLETILDHLKGGPHDLAIDQLIALVQEDLDIN